MKKHFTILSLLVISSFLSSAQKEITLVPFSSNYSDPQGITNCGDSRLFVIQRNGLILICDSAGNKLATPYLDLKSRVKSGGEKGLLGLTFDPDYLTNGYFYVHYTNKNGFPQISRFKVSDTDPNIADTASEKKIFQNRDHLSASHNGGDIHFGPDGYLYIAFGDGGGTAGPKAAQNPLLFLGKMLRIDVHNGNPYSIPADNPFVGDPNYLPEIWAIGFRNPWRWSFDALTGDIHIADVGEASWEEIDFQDSGSTGGQNYGWGCYEGKAQFDTSGCEKRKNYTFPVYVYGHVDSVAGACAIIGGYVYRGTENHNMYGKYLFGDYCSGAISELYYADGKKRIKQVFNGANYNYSLTAFGENYKHELFVTNYVDGGLYHIVINPQPSQSYTSENPAVSSVLSVTPNPSNGNFAVAYKSEKTQQVKISIQNIMGKQFYAGAKSVNGGMNTWKMNLHLPVGDYYISVTDASGKMVNQHLKIL